MNVSLIPGSVEQVSLLLTGSLFLSTSARMDSAALERDAVKFAKTAVTYDQNGKYNEAVFYYKVNNADKIAFCGELLQV